ncbi:MAG: P-II family nitrogen regulator [bacterium]
MSSLKARVKAIVQPEKTDEIIRELTSHGLSGIAVKKVKGRGSEPSQSEKLARRELQVRPARKKYDRISGYRPVH